MITVFTIAYTETLGALAFIMSWVPYAVVYPRAALAALSRKPLFLIWMLPAFAVASTAWSRAPDVTLRYSVQMCLTVAVAVLAARRIPPSRILLLLTGAVFVVAALCLGFGRSSLDVLTGTVTYVGIFNSKNQFGFLIAMLMLTAAAICLSREQPIFVRAGALLAIPLALPLLEQSHSAGAYVSAALALSTLIATYGVARLRPVERALLIMGGAVVAVPAMAFATFAGDAYTSLVENVLQRDATLSGRTELWDFARVLIAEHPWLGLGYSAFWQVGNPDAEFFWRKFYVTGGFHFHNAWIDIEVQLGYPGAILLTALLGAALVTCIAWNWRERSFSSSFFVTVVILLIARGYFEVDLPTQFQPGTLLFFVSLIVGLDAWRRARTGR